LSLICGNGLIFFFCSSIHTITILSGLMKGIWIWR